MADERVLGVASFIGAGPPRFYLPVDPERPNPAYGQLIVNVRDAREIDGLLADLDPWLRETYPDALPVLRKYGVGPSNTWKLEARLVGPAEVEPDVLREVARRVVEVIENEPMAAQVRTDWRERVQKLVPAFNQERARWASVTREDLATTTKRAFDGRAIGLYREGDDLVPIVMRHAPGERQNVAAIDVLQIRPAGSILSVPVGAVVDTVGTAWEDPLIWRRDRRRTITVQANPIPGVTPPELQAAVAARIESLPLPPGFTLEWGGDHESSSDANRSLVPGVIPALAVIALIGITAGLLVLAVPFGFMALLGAMSLVGMMVKNAVVLLDQIRIDRASGMAAYEAVVEAALSRLRPVMLAAGTTVLGVIPLLPDVFWVGMAVTSMGGLMVGSLLTMILVPVLYAILYRAHPVSKGGLPGAVGSGDGAKIEGGTGRSGVVPSTAGSAATARLQAP